MTALAFLAGFLGFSVLGLWCWVASAVPRALREIAVNTRSVSGRSPRLTGLLLRQTILRIAAAALWLLAVVIPLIVAVQGEKLF